MKHIVRIVLLLVCAAFTGAAAATCTLVNFALVRDEGSANALIRVPSQCVDNRVLAAGVAETYTVQSGAKTCLFSSNAPFWARPDATAAVPAADVSDGTGSTFSPAAWYVGATTSISLIAPTVAALSIECYK